MYYSSYNDRVHEKSYDWDFVAENWKEVPYKELGKN
jgi:hypothetical protein